MHLQLHEKMTTGNDRGNRPHRTTKTAAFIFVILFFTTLSALTFIVPIIPTFIITLYTVASTITFITYAIDKSEAQAGKWRISEATLHSMSLFGGWPGALIAQQALRHKSSKTEFRAVYKVTAILNIVVTAWLLTPLRARIDDGTL